MNKLLLKASASIGFTATESKVILFFIALLSAGLVYRLLGSPQVGENAVSFELQDSIYTNIQNQLPISDSTASPVSSTEEARVNDPAPNIFAVSNNSPININTATVQQLDALPGIGPVIAQRIIDYRNQVGKFRQLNQLLDVKGIGDKKFSKIQPFVTIK